MLSRLRLVLVDKTRAHIMHVFIRRVVLKYDTVWGHIPYARAYVLFYAWGLILAPCIYRGVDIRMHLVFGTRSVI
jgi:hypothetical protein